MTGADVHRGVLGSLLDGVLVVRAGGRIETLNPTAKCILGLEPGEADGGGFAELFVAREGLDQFTELVLGATAQEAEPGRHVIEIEGAGGTRSLSVATSYMRPAGGDGASGQAAVVAVFSDITEIRDLRETELRLAKAAEEQHTRLQDAYREIEDRNAAVAAALRKMRVAQGSDILLVFALFLGVGLWSWRGPELSFDLIAELRLTGFGGEAEAVAVQGEGEAGPNTVTVKPRRNSTGITLKGRLSPWRDRRPGAVLRHRAAPGARRQGSGRGGQAQDRHLRQPESADGAAGRRAPEPGQALGRVLGEHGEIGEREVVIGPTTGRRVEIASGLKPAERVVVPDR